MFADGLVKSLKEPLVKFQRCIEEYLTYTDNRSAMIASLFRSVTSDMRNCFFPKRSKNRKCLWAIDLCQLLKIHIPYDFDFPEIIFHVYHVHKKARKEKMKTKIKALKINNLFWSKLRSPPFEEREILFIWIIIYVYQNKSRFIYIFLRFKALASRQGRLF